MVCHYMISKAIISTGSDKDLTVAKLSQVMPVSSHGCQRPSLTALVRSPWSMTGRLPPFDCHGFATTGWASQSTGSVVSYPLVERLLVIRSTPRTAVVRPSHNAVAGLWYVNPARSRFAESTTGWSAQPPVKGVKWQREALRKKRSVQSYRRGQQPVIG